MKSVADLKRRVVAGVQFDVIGHTTRPELVGHRRTVTRVQGNGFYWTHPDDAREVWTSWPTAAGVEIRDADTFRIFRGDRSDGRYVELRFVPTV